MQSSTVPDASLTIDPLQSRPHERHSRPRRFPLAGKSKNETSSQTQLFLCRKATNNVDPQFIIEGLITVICTLLTLFFLPDYPSRANFLTEDDKKFVEARVRVKGGGYTNEHATKKEILKTAFSPRMLAHYLAYLVNSVPIGSLTFFSPQIVNGLGFSSIEAQLMTGGFDDLGGFSNQSVSGTNLANVLEQYPPGSSATSSASSSAGAPTTSTRAAGTSRPSRPSAASAGSQPVCSQRMHTPRDTAASSSALAVLSPARAR
jgi:hypothetical protein